jgi:hypothetical protein
MRNDASVGGRGNLEQPDVDGDRLESPRRAVEDSFRLIVVGHDIVPRDRGAGRGAEHLVGHDGCDEEAPSERVSILAYRRGVAD